MRAYLITLKFVKRLGIYQRSWNGQEILHDSYDVYYRYKTIKLGTATGENLQYRNTASTF